jgi:hypothetical protein
MGMLVDGWMKWVTRRTTVVDGFMHHTFGLPRRGDLNWSPFLGVVIVAVVTVVLGVGSVECLLGCVLAMRNALDVLEDADRGVRHAHHNRQARQSLPERGSHRRYQGKDVRAGFNCNRKGETVAFDKGDCDNDYLRCPGRLGFCTHQLVVYSLGPLRGMPSVGAFLVAHRRFCKTIVRSCLGTHEVSRMMMSL